MMAELVIVDTDGGVDDAFALLMLLSFEKIKNFKIIGITIVNGNTNITNASKNMRLILQTANRTDIPVFCGAQVPLLEQPKVDNFWHGENGFADLIFPEPIVSAQTENAVLALERLCSENKDVTIICLGPLTNIALAIRVFPTFKNRIGELYIMGGAVSGKGNTTRFAEFNFYIDPEAVHVVLTSAPCSIVLLPYEPCLPDIDLDWRFNVLSQPTPHMKILDAVDIKLYSHGWNPCDAFLVAAFIDKSIIVKQSQLCLKVELHDVAQRGRSTVTEDGTRDVINVIEQIDFKLFKHLSLQTAKHIFNK